MTCVYLNGYSDEIQRIVNNSNLSKNIKDRILNNLPSLFSELRGISYDESQVSEEEKTKKILELIEYKFNSLYPDSMEVEDLKGVEDAQDIIYNEVKEYIEKGNTLTQSDIIALEKVLHENTKFPTLASIGIITHSDNNGNYTIYKTSLKQKKLADNSFTSRKLRNKEIAKQTWDKIVEYNKKHVEFDPETHTYTLIKENGERVEVKSTASNLEGTSTKDSITLDSTKISFSIGSQIDELARNVVTNIFENSITDKDSLKESSMTDSWKGNDDLLEFVIERVLDLKNTLDNSFGEGNYKVESLEVPLGVFKEDGKGLGGTMDLFVHGVDKNGNPVYGVIDIKTYKEVGSEELQKRIKKWEQQISVYMSMLEEIAPEVKGKLLRPIVLDIPLSYDSMGQVYDGFDYSQIKPNSNSINRGTFVEMTRRQLNMKLRGVNYSEFRHKADLLSLSIEAPFTPSELKQIGDYIGFKFSDTISEVLKDSSFIEDVLYSLNKSKDEVEKTKHKFNTSKKTRKDVIEIVGEENLLNFVLETIDSENLRSARKGEAKTKRIYFRENPNVFINYAFAKIKDLEQHKLKSNNNYDLSELEELEDIEEYENYIDNEDSSEDNETLDDNTENEEERGIEHWMVNQIEVSQFGNLSQQIKFFFSTLENYQANTLDSDEIWFPLFYNAQETYQTVKSLIAEKTSIAEMIKELKMHVTKQPYIQTVIDRLESDKKFASAFYADMRGVYLQYGTIRRNEEGQIIASIENKKDAFLTMRASLRTFLRKYENSGPLILPEGRLSSVDITAGEGYVNMTVIDYIHNILSNRSSSDESSNDTIPLFDNVVQRAITSFKNARYADPDMNYTIGDIYLQELDKPDTPESRPIHFYIAYFRHHILDKLGIFPTDEALLNILGYSSDGPRKNDIKDLKNQISGLLSGYRRSALKDTPFSPVGKGELALSGDYSRVIGILAEHTSETKESSTRTNGKTYQSYTRLSQLSKTIADLKSLRTSYFIDKYGTGPWLGDTTTRATVLYNPWLKILNGHNGEWFKENLEHKNQLHAFGTTYAEMTSFQYQQSLLIEFFEGYKKNPGTDMTLAWYHVPILSDKPASEFIKFVRYIGKDYQKDILKGYVDIAHSEVMRIASVIHRAAKDASGKIKVYDISNSALKDPAVQTLLETYNNGDTVTMEMVKAAYPALMGSGASFRVLENINMYLSNMETLSDEGEPIFDYIASTLNKANKNEIEPKIAEEFEATIKAYTKEYLGDQAREFFNSLEEQGMFELTGKGKNTKFKHLPFLTPKFEAKDKDGNPRKQKDIEKEILDSDSYHQEILNYFFNSHFATTNINILMAGDMAFYKNADDFQKRNAQVHSMTQRLNPDAVLTEDMYGYREDGDNRLSDGKMRVLYLKDAIHDVKAVVEPHIRKLFESDGDAYYKAELERILNAFSEINETDGQAYTSPTAMRKKLAMAGKWGQEEEQAYTNIRNKVRAGQPVNPNDFKVILRVLKPFTYTRYAVEDTSDNPFADKITVAAQHKNSEYMLFLGAMFLNDQEATDNNYALTALYEFMEESHYDADGNYKNNGIDTIMFESAVKIGIRGAVDINNASSKQEALEILRRPTYTADGSYNYDSIQEFPIEDYGFQQEVPNHGLDHKQQMGSQSRILSVANLNPDTIIEYKGRKISIGELRNRYYGLIAKEINSAKERLFKKLGISDNVNDIGGNNQKLSIMLQEEIKGSNRYSMDLLKAVQLNDKGQFNIPLDDPSISLDIQYLLHALIKKNLNKIKVSGGPLVQLTSFGTKNALGIVFKEDGSIDHFEAAITVPDSRLERALTKPDGTMYSIQEAIDRGIIDEDILESVGYRIPTEDKHSMIPIKVKYFLPRAGGDVIMLPKEITALTGSDFDVDKFYLALKELGYDVSELDPEVVKQKFEEIAKDHHLNENQLKVLNDNINELWELSKNKKGKKDKEKSKRFYEILNEAGIGNNKKVRSKVVAALRESSKVKVVSKESNKNEIMEIQRALLQTKESSRRAFLLGSFDPLKQNAYSIAVVKESAKSGNPISYEEALNMSINEKRDMIFSNRDIANPMSQVYYQRQNSTARKLIGLIANHNISHSIANGRDIQYSVGNNAFILGDTKIEHTVNLDAYTASGKPIGRSISEFATASVDAVKDPVLSFMNYGLFTTGIGMSLIRLGVDPETVSLFLANPIIEHLVSEYEKSKSESYSSFPSFVKEYVAKNKITFTKSLENRDKKPTITKEDLIVSLSGDISKVKGHDNFKGDMIDLFVRAYNISQNINEFTFITKFNSPNNAGGPSIASTLHKQLRISKFTDPFSDGGQKLFSDNAKSLYEEASSETDLISAFLNNTIGESSTSAYNRIFKGRFIGSSKHFIDILKYISDISGNIPDENTINRIMMEYILFNMTSSGNALGSISSRQSRDEFYNSNNRNSKINKIIEVLKRRGNENAFLSKLHVNTTYTGIGNVNYQYLTLNVDSISKEVDTMLSLLWADLLKSKDQELQMLAFDLFELGLMQYGQYYNPNSWVRLAPIELRMAFDKYTESILNIENANVHSFIRQYYRNNYKKTKAIKKFTKESLHNLKYQEEFKDKIKIEEEGSDFSIIVEKEISYVLSRFKTNGNYVDYINIDGKLYELLGSSSNTEMRYRLVKPLGIPGVYKEYNASDSLGNEDSIFSIADNASNEESDSEDFGNDDTNAIVFEGRVFTPSSQIGAGNGPSSQLSKEAQEEVEKQKKGTC